MVLVLCALLGLGTTAVQTLTYPDSYRALHLPELPDATITSTGRTSTNLRDGISLRLTSTKSLPDVREFYRDALVKLGFADAGTGGRGARSAVSVAGLTFRKGALTYSATLASVQSEVRITISVIEK